MCVENEGNGCFFQPEMRELRDPQTGVELDSWVSLHGYDFCKIHSLRVELGLQQLGVVVNSYSNPLRLRLRGQSITYL